MKMKKDLNKVKKNPYYIAEPIRKMLDKAKEQVIKRDWDRVYIVDGNEGGGKSVLGLQLAKHLDPTFNIDRVTFTGEEFSKAIRESEKNQAIIFDEAFNGLSSSGASSKLNRFIVSKLMECRQKNLFIIVILPTIFLLQKYAAIFRSQALFHVYTTKAGERGYYKVYNRSNKKTLYLAGQKFYTYKLPYVKKSYRFYNIYPLNEEDYRLKKSVAMHDQIEQDKLDRYALKFALLAKLLKEKYDMNYKDIINHLKDNEEPISKNTLTSLIQRLPKKASKSP